MFRLRSSPLRFSTSPKSPGLSQRLVRLSSSNTVYGPRGKPILRVNRTIDDGRPKWDPYEPDEKPLLGRLLMMFSKKAIMGQTAVTLMRCCEIQSNREEFLTPFGKPAAPFCLPMVIDSGAVIDQPKNFNSWFMLNLLHLWMCYFRLRYEEKDGADMSEHLSNAFWKFAEARMISSGVTSGLLIGKQLKDYSEIYYGSLLSYDEAIARGDAQLADALYRNLFMRNPKTLESIPWMVHYIRRELYFLEGSAGDRILLGLVKWSDPFPNSPIKREPLPEAPVLTIPARMFADRLRSRNQKL